MLWGLAAAAYLAVSVATWLLLFRRYGLKTHAAPYDTPTDRMGYLAAQVGLCLAWPLLVYLRLKFGR
jgi:hypothetical protein